MQLNRMKKMIAGGTLAASLLLTGVVGFAQQETQQEQGGRERGAKQWRGDKGRHGMRGGFGGRFFEKLNLTDAQKEQMKQIAMRYRESAKAQRQQRGERRGGGGFDALTDGTFNEAAVRAAAQARANAQVEREVMHARMMSEMYAILTPEQKAQLAAERQERQQRRQERRSRRQANQGQN